ncbi:putative 4'-phosphopantetheinyl transferase family domain protein [Synechococcus sp. MEDNS5]|uniref:4'-phosphopantetheinyl transferase family protein n=1 Tax=Synechococcus sp. MEDNS5 TaxID=1442554 RepID=UPI001644E36B|nr:4'-phosphopantetheinyl transferase superfamily protein [Synechococcus sp. MEDNS5]QNJ05456.1 putative 4'-phosphopantetheinyl transferase family domain protein [Synechococcus sp. MEDNS5]
MSFEPSFVEQRKISHNFVQHLLGHSGLKFPIEIGRTIYGKPQLRNSNIPIYFNISHSECLTVGITHSQPIGIDIEAEDRRIDINEEFIYSEIFMSKDEALLALKTHTLLELWTIKEAVLKANGYGLWGGLKNVSIKMQCANHGKAFFYKQRFEVELIHFGRFVISKAVMIQT